MFVRRRDVVDLRSELRDVASRVRSISDDINGTVPAYDGFMFTTGKAGIEKRLKAVEEKVSLILEHFNLCQTTTPATTKLKRCK